MRHVLLEEESGLNEDLIVKTIYKFMGSKKKKQNTKTRIRANDDYRQEISGLISTL